MQSPSFSFQRCDKLITYDRKMYTLGFTLLAVLGFITMIGATPLDNRPYVPLILALGDVEVLTRLEIISPVHHNALNFLVLRFAGTSALSIVTIRLA